jgi:predicted oxidoreductase (fatty acid repression mutant protein)
MDHADRVTYKIWTVGLQGYYDLPDQKGLFNDNFNQASQQTSAVLALFQWLAMRLIS